MPYVKNNSNVYRLFEYKVILGATEDITSMTFDWVLHFLVNLIFEFIESTFLMYPLIDCAYTRFITKEEPMLCVDIMYSKSLHANRLPPGELSVAVEKFQAAKK